MLWAFLESSGELCFSFCLENISIGRSNTIPIFCFASVKKIDGCKLHIFCVPTEKAFPRSKITIWSINTKQRKFHSLGQNRIKIIKIPASRRIIHKGKWYICSIQRRAEGYILPKQLLNFLWTLSVSYMLETFRSSAKFTHRHGLI